MKTTRHCLATDLKDNPELIAKYKEYHQAGNGFPEVAKSIRDAGIVEMEIYLINNRLFMIMDVDDSFDPVAKAAADAQCPVVQKWETLMWQFQQALPWAKEGDKWLPMEEIFKLTEQP
jgi:L-rhamnose mutarotase